MQVYNFNAGPAALPKEVMQKAQEEFVDYRGCGYGIVEESHRSPAFDEIIEAAEANLRKLMGISDDYEVLFLQGGASLQFAMIPMNIMVPGKKIGWANTGNWAKKALKEAKILGADIDMIYDGTDSNFTKIDNIANWKVDQDLAYMHICANNTIFGTEFHEYPNTGKVPLIADMSSDIMSHKIDVNKFALIFAGAQKNIAPAGLTLVIIRKDLVDRCPDTVPTLLRYSTHIDKGSMFNTPPTFSIYMMRLVTDWLIANGGIEHMQKVNESKAKKLYDYIDSTDFYRGTAAVDCRSKMNVCFRLATEELEKEFVAVAKSEGLIGLKGHRVVGGCRASIYNAVPEAGVDKLISVMKAFKAKHA